MLSKHQKEFENKYAHLIESFCCFWKKLGVTSIELNRKREKNGGRESPISNAPGLQESHIGKYLGNILKYWLQRTKTSSGSDKLPAQGHLVLSQEIWSPS